MRSLVCLVGAVSGLAFVAQAAAELPVLTSVDHVQWHPQATPQPRYEASVRSIHPGAIRDRSRNWTYRGDTVRVAFRNATARPSNSQLYRVCYTKNRRLACRIRRIRGRSWDAWRLRIMPPWAGFVNGRYRRYVEFTWRVDRRIVARTRIWVYE